jgi:exopolysaccharide biosynthesis polyprenyl glycosylphosphotransferase
MVRHFNLRFTLFLFISDLTALALAIELATQARTQLPFGRPGEVEVWTLPWPVYVMGLIVWGVIFAASNVYNPRQMVYLSLELVRITEATFISWLVLAGLLYFTYRDVSRLQYVYSLGFFLMLIYTHRLAVRSWFKFRGGQRYDPRRVLIVGTGDNAREIAKMIRAHGWMGLKIVGYVAEDNTESHNPLILGSLAETPNVIQEHAISEVVIALSRDAAHETEVKDLIYRLQALPVNIRLIPDYFDLAFLRINIEDFSGMPLLSLKEPVLDPFQRLVKRAFDLAVTFLLLIPGLPLMGILALAIRRDSPGPAIFKQPRVGEGGCIFTMYKFRTMVIGAETMQDQVTTMDENGNMIYKVEDDPRVTRLGRWLRSTSLDELPQLFNILRGEMSLVGPRPEMPWLVDSYEDWQRKRFEVPQGLTGWWQISGRADKPMHLHTEDDLYYIRNYSVWMDLKIIWLTITAVITRRGAF